MDGNNACLSGRKRSVIGRRYNPTTRQYLFIILTNNLVLFLCVVIYFSIIFIQCVQSSLSQNGGADLRAHCNVKFPMTLKMGLERSQLFPEIFEIVLRPFWWAAGSEQPSPPLHRAAAARLLRCFDKYKSLYTRNLLAIIFLVYNNLYLSKHLSSRAAAAR